MREQVDQVRDIKRELKQVRRARSRIASDRMGGGMGTYYYGGKFVSNVKHLIRQ